MAQMIVIYVTCESEEEAEKIANDLLKRKLAACVNIIPDIGSMYFWPPQTTQVDRSEECVLLLKTFEEHFDEIEEEIQRVHSYDVPAIFSLKIDQVSHSFLGWMKEQLKSSSPSV